MLRRRSAILKKIVVPIAMPHAACANFKIANGRMEDVRFAMGVPVGLAHRRGAFATLVVEADFPALVRLWALE